MSANSVHCHIFDGDVSVISDINGNVTNVVCPEFSRLDHACRKKSRESSGFFSLYLKKVADQAAGTRAAYCEFAEPKQLLSK